jgi:hypothetical protein
MLLLVGLSPSAAQKPLGLPGPADADPLDAFGSKPNVTICPSNKPFQCEAGNCVTNPTKCEPVRPCPEDRSLRCSDGRCVAEALDCDYGILRPPN